jgi:hypothetical protein
MPIDGMVTGIVSLAGPDPRPTYRFQTNPLGGYVEGGYVEGGYVEDSGSRATYTAQVSSSLIDSFDADPLWHGVRIELDGEVIPESELTGPVKWGDSIDTALATAEIKVVGRRWSSFVTDKSWTKVAIEIFHRHGQADLGEGAMREDLVFSGIVMPTSAQSTDGTLAEVTIKAASRAALYDRHELCEEVAPLSGLTRGQISTLMGGAVGFTAFDIPDGAAYVRPIFTAQAKIFEYLQRFGEPEGWHWDVQRIDGEDVLRAYLAEIKTAPQPPDAEWHLDSVETLRVESPPESPSRWIVRGFRTLLVDEAGETIERTRIEVEEEYAPKVAVEKQDSTDGTHDATGFSPGTPTLRITQVIEDEVHRRGQLITEQITREWGWFNPRAGRLRTPNTAEGDGPVTLNERAGYHYTAAYIDEEGAFVTWAQERFVQMGERRVGNVYNGEKNLIESRRHELGWHTRDAGVFRNSGAWVLGTLVSDDDRSYSRRNNAGLLAPEGTIQFEGFGEFEEEVITFEYGSSGAATREHHAIYSFDPIFATIDAGEDYYTRVDGRAQTELSCNRKLSRESDLLNVLSANNELRGIIETAKTYVTRASVAGFYEWGDVKSNELEQRYRVASRKNTIYSRLTRTLYRVLVLETGKPPEAQTLTGQPPPPQFKTSPWTLLEQQPFELILEDPVALARFGFARQVIESDFAQTNEEATALIERRRRRQGAHRLTITRPLSYAQKGDTVLVTDPTQGIGHRCLLVSRECEIDPREGRASATYTLEAYL